MREKCFKKFLKTKCCIQSPCYVDQTNILRKRIDCILWFLLLLTVMYVHHATKPLLNNRS